MKKTRKTKARIGPAVAARCEVGPYLGYMGSATYDAEDGVFGGRVLGIEDIIHFEGTTPEEVAEAFRGSVDDYLNHCRRRGKEPNKPFSGKFSLRMPAQMHRQLSMLAETRQTSLNALVLTAIESFTRE